MAIVILTVLITLGLLNRHTREWVILAAAAVVFLYINPGIAVLVIALGAVIAFFF